MNNELSLKYRIQFKIMRILANAIALLGIKRAYVFARWLGVIAWYVLPKRRKIAISNIKKYLGLGTFRATVIAKASFKENFCSFFDLLFTQDFGEEGKKISFKSASPKNNEALFSDQRGVVGTTGHFGAWELLASVLGRVRKNDIPSLVVVRKYSNPAINKFITEQRQACGGTMVGHKMAAPQVLRALRKNGVAAFLVDHKPLRSFAINVPFFNIETAVNIGPALLAVRGQALVIPVFLNRQDGEYIFHVYDALDTKELEGSVDEKINAVATFYTKAMEEHIRDFPEQWFWMHDRWKEFRVRKKRRGKNAKEDAS